MSSDEQNSTADEFEVGAKEGNTKNGEMVAIGGQLPNSFQVPTSKLLDVIVALSPTGRGLQGKQRKSELPKPSIELDCYSLLMPVAESDCRTPWSMMVS